MDTIEEHIIQAFHLHQQGNLEAADLSYRSLIATQPDHPELNFLFGTLRYQIGDLQTAEKLLRHSIKINSSNAQAYANLSLVLQDVGNIDEALATNEQAIVLNSNNPDAHNNRSALLYSVKRFEEAIASAQAALQLNPSHPGALNNLGLALQSVGRVEEAEECFRKNLLENANDTETLNNLSALLCSEKRYRDALPVLSDLVSLEPDVVDSNANLAKILSRLNQAKDAEKYLRHALVIDPEHVFSLYQLSELLRLEGRFAESAAISVKLMKNPEVRAGAKGILALSFIYARLKSAYNELINTSTKDELDDTTFQFARLLSKQNDPDSAVKECREMLRTAKDDSSFHWYLAFLELARGEYIEGFKEYDWRFHPDRPMGKHGYDKPEWDGRELANEKLLIHGEQGFGDIIQFIRYLPWVAERCKSLVFIDQGQAIYDLLSTQDESEEPLESDAPADDAPANDTLEVEFDYQIPVMSLPKVFGTTLETIPWDGPYLRPTPKRVAQWKKRIGDSPGIKIGIVWAGNPNQKNDHNRSCRLADFAPLAKIPGIRWFALQKGPVIDQAASPPPGMQLDVLDADINNFSDTMAAVASLDLVISVDTSVAHLVGAMGGEGWCLLCFDPDWRWMYDRDDSPWYPTLRLFRQTGISDWSSAFKKVEAALIDYVSERIDRLAPAQQQRLSAYKLVREGQVDAGIAALTPMLASPDEVAYETIEQAVDIAINRNRVNQLLPLFEKAEKAPALSGFARLLNQASLQNDAFDVWQKAIHLPDADVGTFVDCSDAYLNAGRYEEGLGVCRKGIERWPNAAELHVQRARTLQNMGQFDDALSAYQTALQIDSGHPRALNNSAVLLTGRGNYHEAELLLQKLLRYNAIDAKGWGNLGNVYGALKEHYLARIFFERAIELAPDLPYLHVGHAAALFALGRFDEAKQACHRCLDIAPSRIDAHVLLAKIYWASGQLDEAATMSKKALALDPNSGGAHFILSLCYLSWGDYKNGWLEYEWRPQDPNDLGHKFQIPRWDGSPLNGRKLIVHSEQGLGDAIQSLRYLRLLQGEQVTLHCQNGLARLFATSPLVKQVLDQNDFDPAMQYEHDVYHPLMSFPCLFGLEESDLSCPTPIFDIDEALVKQWGERLGNPGSFKVGLVWAGSAVNVTDNIRSCRLDDFAPLAKVAGVSFYSLQKGDAVNQIQSTSMPITDLSNQLHDFVDTAAAILNLDLIISVDTAVVHLAGSLGKPVWTLLATKPDWRWQLEREDTPWYASMRLFRQRNAGDWSELMGRVATELNKLVSASAVTSVK